MHWRVKAFIQRTIASLPERVSYPAYYWVQRRFGSLRRPDPTKKLKRAVQAARFLAAAGTDIEGKRFLELGTGRVVTVPLGLWLCGASSVVTADLNPYLQAELVLQSLRRMREKRSTLPEIFGEYANRPQFKPRLAALLDGPDTLDHVLSTAHIRYLAPTDARALPLPSGAIDIYFSSTVLEHIPPKTIQELFAEGRRVLSPGGLFVHFVDLSDHFAHSDARISRVNFLRFTEAEWSHLAGNRYMYQNRLRLPELRELLQQQGLRIVYQKSELDERSSEALAAGLPLAERFRGFTRDELATINLYFVATPEG